MGIDYDAHALIGCEVTGKLYTKSSKPSCDHVNPPKQRFCGVCGKEIKAILVEEPIKGFDEDHAKIGELDVIYGGFRGDNADRIRVFVGVQVQASAYDDRYAKRHPTLVLASRWTTSKIIETLQPLGLWDPETFGLWAVLGCG